MTSKRIINEVQNGDGMFITYAGEYIAYASRNTDERGDYYAMSYHKGEMPSHGYRSFDTLDGLETSMRELEPDLRRWRKIVQEA